MVVPPVPLCCDPKPIRQEFKFLCAYLGWSSEESNSALEALGKQTMAPWRHGERSERNYLHFQGFQGQNSAAEVLM